MNSLNSVKELSRAIREAEQAGESLRAATENLRLALRHYLQDKTPNRGDLTAVAKALGVSISLVGNLKGGYGTASPEWARSVMSTLGDI